MNNSQSLIEVRNLYKEYTDPGGQIKQVLDNLSFVIKTGEAFGLAGISGSGKSTVGRIIMNLEKASSGEIFFQGLSIFKKNLIDTKKIRANMQMVFQNPLSSMNPRRTAQSIIEMPLKSFGIGNVKERKDRVYELLNLVGLNPRHAEYYPHQFSGGQCQRLGIARALASRPKFIFLDEPVSALDVSIQAQILNLLKELQEKFNLTYLIVANNLNIEGFIADRIAVIHDGKIVEMEKTEILFNNPQKFITKELLKSILNVNLT